MTYLEITVRSRSVRLKRRSARRGAYSSCTGGGRLNCRNTDRREGMACGWRDPCNGQGNLRGIGNGNCLRYVAIKTSLLDWEGKREIKQAEG
jgi:hypothetical protein